MGRNRLTTEQKQLRGNPGKREIEPETEIDVPIRCPMGLSKGEKKYWYMWSPALVEAGRLTMLTIPSFLDLIKMKVRLDLVNEFIEGNTEKCEMCGKQNNRSLLQETKFVDGAGVEHSSFRESAYSKLSRDLTLSVYRLEKAWGLTADSAAGIFTKKKKKSPEEEFLG